MLQKRNTSNPNEAINLPLLEFMQKIPNPNRIRTNPTSLENKY